MEELNIYLIKRTFKSGYSHDWTVEATETEKDLLVAKLKEEDRVEKVDVEKLDSGTSPSHIFDSNGQLWCQVTDMNIYN
jgi:hypothetical protein